MQYFAGQPVPRRKATEFQLGRRVDCLCVDQVAVEFKCLIRLLPGGDEIAQI